MPSKPLNTDYDPLELADGWDREADRSTPPAAAPGDDWDTPLDDVNWDEPAVKNMTEVSAPPPEEVLPPVTGDKLVEMPTDDDIDAAPFKRPEDDDGPLAEPELPPPPPPESVPTADSPPQEPFPENQEDAEDSAGESEAAGAGEDLAGSDDVPIALKKAKPVKVELDLEGMRLQNDPLDDEGDDEEEPDYKESDEVNGLPPELEPRPISWPPAGKITWAKLLLLFVPAVLLVAGLTFMGYQLFFSSPEKIADSQLHDVWPVPEPVGAGDWQLEPFFFLLSGPTAQEPVEVMITVFYDQPELLLDFKDDLPLYRDYIFRYIQHQDVGILTDPARQEKLQSDLRALLNQKLGAPAVTHLGLVFTR